MFKSPLLSLALWWSLSFLISISTLIITAKCSYDPSNAGRGGAVVVTCSFFFIFPFYGLLAKKSSSLPVQEKEIGRWKTIFDLERNITLAAVAVTGTLFWGFADLFVGPVKRSFLVDMLPLFLCKI